MKKLVNYILPLAVLLAILLLPACGTPNGVSTTNPGTTGRATYGPAYKNPNAAGRLRERNRNAPAVTPSTRERLSGPAYKNQVRRPAPGDTTITTLPPSRKLTSPRYKNRNAKSRRSQ